MCTANAYRDKVLAKLTTQMCPSQNKLMTRHAPLLSPSAAATSRNCASALSIANFSANLKRSPSGMPSSFHAGLALTCPSKVEASQLLQPAPPWPSMTANSQHGILVRMPGSLLSPPPCVIEHHRAAVTVQYSVSDHCSD
eukprot:9278-Heterococcus_DN1.PRE.1